MKEKPISTRNASVADVEAVLLGIWQDSLPLPSGEITKSVSFLGLGGDSLSAMICISRIRAAFSVEFNILDFFVDDSTISDFAKNIVTPRDE
jgi:acyl carrier protein